MIKIGVYARVSTKDQHIDTQLNILKDYVIKNNYELHKIYADIGHSGKKESRPEFDKFLDDMRHNRFNTILVYKLDRIGRSLQHLLRLFEEFNKRNVDFISLTQNIGVWRML